jgi:DNA recombination protein RmuC
MEIILAFLVLLLGIAVAVLVMRQQKSQPTAELAGTMQALIQQQGQQLQHTTQLLLQQMSQSRDSQERSSLTMHNRLDHATKVVSDVQSKLSQLEEANKRIFDLGKDISGLQKILQAPKLRGTMGEIWLKELIGQILPKENYQMQYGFKSGEACDAVIFLRDGMLLPVDSKFSLENFVKMVEAEEEFKVPFRKQFASDIKKRIDEIAKKYILPSEGTLEFAFMYVPAENVYYQAFIQEEDDLGLLAYAFSKRIIPVSPSSFYAYLQVILFGLRGMEIEKSAKEIQKNLTGLQGEFGKFQEAHELIGTHLRRAEGAWDQSAKRVEKIELKLQDIASVEQATLEAVDPNLITHAE